MKKLTKIGNNLSLYFLQETRVVFLHDEIGRFSTNEAMLQLEYLSRLNKKPITLRICSPGGSVDHGLVIYDFIKSSKVPIYTLCSGMAASMAAVLLGGGFYGKRAATKHSRIMIHQPSSGFIGRASDIEIHAKETARVRKLLNTLIAKDTGNSFNKVSKDTELDYWMDAEEALKYGIIDKIV